MSDLTEKWTKNSFDVEAVQVTEDNIYQVTKWCHGRVFHSPVEGRHIYLTVVDGSRMVEAKIYPGQWIAFFEGEFRRYQNSEFMANFRKPIRRLPNDSFIRKVIRDELKSLLESLGRTADNSYGYGDGRDEIYLAFKGLVEDEAMTLPHSWTCAKRKFGMSKCDCGVGEES